MFGKGKDKYTKLPDEHEVELTEQRKQDSKLQKYKLPSLKKPVVFNSQNNNISYTAENGDIVTIKKERLAGFLREVREQGVEGWGFDGLFQKMSELTKFEAYLKTSPTTALIDYRLLRLGGHIRTLQGKQGAASTNADAATLSTLYKVLVAKLQEYELKIGELANKPSRHQNEQRKKLVEDFQSEWQQLVRPIANKYKGKIDTYNILLNVAVACTGFGLAWLFLKNIYRLSQRKGLGLFQFEQAHSRKVENVEKFYDDVIKATDADASELQNYFTDDLKDTDKSFNQLSDLIDNLQSLHATLPTDETYTKKEKKALGRTIEAFRSTLHTLQQDLQAYRRDPDNADETLSEIQTDFMEAWQKATTDHNVSENSTILISKYPLACTQKMTDIAQISEQFGQELAQLKQQEQEHQTGRDSPSSHGSDSSLT